MKKKVFVLMSGGVDSSVAAALLNLWGFDVIGIHLKISHFCKPEDEEDARQVCELLNVPFYVFDITQDYQRLIALSMIRDYACGYTPNPDIECNRLIKFDLVFKKLSKIKFDYLATGHYAQIIDGKLYAAKDISKDQSYFLWRIKRSLLKKILFPIGGYLKSEVRKLARELGLPNFAKKDSQGICFLGKVSLRDYLKQFLPVNQGPVYDVNKQLVGVHSGHYFFTEGQRHGLNLYKNGPFFVVSKKPEKNTLIVAQATDPELYSKAISFNQPNWLLNPVELNNLSRGDKTFDCLVRVRYRQPLVPATLDLVKNIAVFKEPIRAVALGQSAVFYQENGDQLLVLGGGVIKKRL